MSKTLAIDFAHNEARFAEGGEHASYAEDYWGARKSHERIVAICEAQRALSREKVAESQNLLR
jgi:hypothetical protein